MKRMLLSILLLCCFSIACLAQTLSGEYSNDGKSTGSYYTKINWAVSYQFEEKGGNFYIKFYKPKISVPNYSRYHDEFGKEYSLADLGLASWPNARQLPFAMSVKVNVSDGYKNYEMGASCNADFTCGDNYIVSKANAKNVTVQNFRVTGVIYFRANLGGEPAVDDLLKSRRQSAVASSGREARPGNNGSADKPVNEPKPGYTIVKPSAATQTLETVGSLIQNIGNQMQADAEQKRQQEHAKMEREEEQLRIAMAEAVRLRQMGDNRAKLLNSYGGGSVPLSSKKIDVDTIYYFCFNYSRRELENEKLNVAISNVFPVTRYKDGTWIFTADLKSDICKVAGVPDVALSGHYDSKTEAVNKQNELMKKSEAMGITVQKISYNTKKTEGSTTTDFWGNPAKPASAEKTAPDGKKEEKKAAEKLDFWGNPIKN